jgi:hypothetical protein
MNSAILFVAEGISLYSHRCNNIFGAAMGIATHCTDSHLSTQRESLGIKAGKANWALLTAGIINSSSFSMNEANSCP